MNTLLSALLGKGSFTLTLSFVIGVVNYFFKTCFNLENPTIVMHFNSSANKLLAQFIIHIQGALPQTNKIRENVSQLFVWIRRKM